MDRDDIIRMAREAGLHIATDVNWMPIISFEYAKKFAEVICAEERTKISASIKQIHDWYSHEGNQE